MKHLVGDDLAKFLTQLREDIHRHPELSFQETETAQRLRDALDELSIESELVAGTGVIARVPGTHGDAPAVAIRGDIDALPVTEATGLPYSSANPGVMHACGHDVHATWALGAAALLKQKPARGDVVIIFQPGEETGHGAERMISAGALDGVACIFGGHVDRRFDIGMVVAQPGPLAASADTFRIELLASGAHGARPHESADPIVGASHVVTALQTLVSRNIDPALPAVVTVGRISAGTAPNIIPDRAVLEGTIRATTPLVRQQLIEGFNRVVSSVAEAFGLQCDMNVDLGPGPVINSVVPSSWAAAAAKEILGDSATVPLGFTNMAGEDFSAYLEQVPGCFLRIGAREPGGETIAAHAPKFYAHPDAVFVGSAVLAQAARNASNAINTQEK